jgi:hypothetical protein
MGKVWADMHQRVDTDEAVFLMLYHLNMARAFWECIDLTDRAVERRIEDHFDQGLELKAMLAWHEQLVKDYNNEGM